MTIISWYEFSSQYSILASYVCPQMATVSSHTVTVTCSKRNAGEGRWLSYSRRSTVGCSWVSVSRLTWGTSGVRLTWSNTLTAGAPEGRLVRCQSPTKLSSGFNPALNWRPTWKQATPASRVCNIISLSVPQIISLVITCRQLSNKICDSFNVM